MSNWNLRGVGREKKKGERKEEKKKRRKKRSRLNQKSGWLKNASYDTSKSTKASRIPILHAKIIYGVEICEGTTEGGHKRERGETNMGRRR